MSIPATNPTYYEILNLSPSALTSLDEPAAASLIKRAYRRALLRHHPDKKSCTSSSSSSSPPPSSLPSSLPASAPGYTIDQISAAYATLSRPALRQAYDRSLLVLQSQRHRPSSLAPSSATESPGAGGGGAADFQTGIETVDLDDLDYEEKGRGRDSETTWYRPCRCGNPRGYQFGEADLEDAADLGELMVGCADCSLWLRVCFAVLDDDDDGQDEKGSGEREQHAGKGNGDGMKPVLTSGEVAA
ncbi:uncharacterized protein P884DRAFT_255596 [Thermothelomyces heterothallicus CBS 202.75]|uniref:uncharacterized protein n=1 Tax=Thermothelomyces heterothallicus CBS 202.75 TaxID=1149848 RepID=UPI003742FEF3